MEGSRLKSVFVLEHRRERQYIANIGGVVSASDSTLLSTESFFHQDLNGDGQVVRL
jgi:hypothetical protein